jgi:hypothetical protein
MRNIFTAIMLFVFCTLTFMDRALGQESSKRAPASDVTYKKTTKLDFEDAGVDGEFVNPDGQALNADQNLSFDSLLEPKDDFKGELKRSMGAVR